MIDFDEFIKSGDPEKIERARMWQASIGLQDVDGLKVSDYLLQVAEQHIEGKITIKEAVRLIDSYYETHV